MPRTLNWTLFRISVFIVVFLLFQDLKTRNQHFFGFHEIAIDTTLQPLQVNTGVEAYINFFSQADSHMRNLARRVLSMSISVYYWQIRLLCLNKPIPNKCECAVVQMHTTEKQVIKCEYSNKKALHPPYKRCCIRSKSWHEAKFKNTDSRRVQ